MSTERFAAVVCAVLCIAFAIVAHGVRIEETQARPVDVAAIMVTPCDAADEDTLVIFVRADLSREVLFFDLHRPSTVLVQRLETLRDTERSRVYLPCPKNTGVIQ